MFKNPKMALLTLALAPTLMAWGCGGDSGWWRTLWMIAEPIEELIQTAHALSLI